VSQDLIQLDTLDISLCLEWCQAIYRRDVISKWDVVEVYKQATSTLAAQFLDSLQPRMPFPIKAIQVDSGQNLRQFSRKNARRETSDRLYFHLIHPN